MQADLGIYQPQVFIYLFLILKWNGLFVEKWSVSNMFKMIFFSLMILVLQPFQGYFTYIEPAIHWRWAQTGVPEEKPPDFLQAELVFLAYGLSEASAMRDLMIRS